LYAAYLPVSGERAQRIKTPRMSDREVLLIAVAIFAEDAPHNEKAGSRWQAARFFSRALPRTLRAARTRVMVFGDVAQQVGDLATIGAHCGLAATEISEAISTYSMAVAPSSFFFNLRRMDGKNMP